MRENCTSGPMSGSERPGHGGAIEALPEETGSQPTGSTYRYGARARLYCNPLEESRRGGSPNTTVATGRWTDQHHIGRRSDGSVADKDEFDIQMMVSFDHDVYVEDDILGLEIPVSLESVQAELRFPGPRQVATRALTPPRGAGDGVEKYLRNEVWGIADEANPRLYITGAMLVVHARGPLPDSITEEQFQGGPMQELVQQAADWWEAFCRWVWAITTQSLNATYPDPRVLHRASKTVITQLLRGDEMSVPSSGAPTLSIYQIPTGQYSERLLGANTAKAAAKAVGDPPVIMELMAAARMAAGRGDRRRAVIDAGTAAEAALTALLGLPSNHRLTLGALVTKAEESGMRIPQDAASVLVAHRNGAIHRGISPSGSDLERCLTIAEDLVAQVTPEYVPVGTMKAFARPQRHDLLIITGPRASDDHQAS